MKDDLIDAVEIRNVNGFLINCNGSTSTTLEELEFLTKQKNLYKNNENPLLMGFIHTGVKV